MRIAVLASGRGSNLQAIINNIAAGQCTVELALVLSDKADAYALQRAEAAGIEHYAVLPCDYADKEAYEQALLCKISAKNCDLIVLAGYMRLVGHTLLDAFGGRIINIHPALLPSFKGLHAQKQALEYGVKISGCTVHFVDSGMDTGSIIAQAAVEVLPDDDEDRLSARILEQEHRLLPAVIDGIAKGIIKIQNKE